MFGAKSSKPQDRIDCLIGAGTTVDGNVVFSGGLRVDGTVRGNIHAEIRVPHIVVNGLVAGPVHSSEYVELQSKASVTGDVHYNTLEMQLGAVVQGRLVHVAETGSDKIIQLKPASGD